MKRYAFTNCTDHVQVVKTRIQHWERTLFPGQQVAFEAEPDDFLEIYSHESSTSVLTDRTPCQSLLEIAEVLTFKSPRTDSFALSSR